MSGAKPDLEETGAAPSPAGTSRSRVQSLAGWALRLAVGVGILYYLFTFIPVSSVFAALGSARAGWVALGLVAVAGERWLAAVRTTILSDQSGMSLSVGDNLEISLVSIFYGMFLPGDLAGGAVRWYRMSRPEGMRAQAAAVITFDRLIGTIVLFLTGLAFWLVESPPLSSRPLELSFLALLAVLLAVLVLSLSGRAVSFFFAPLSSLAGRLGLGFVSERLEKVLVSIVNFGAMGLRTAGRLLVVTLLRQLVAIVLLYGFAASLELGVGFVTLGWVRAFVSVATLLPISVSGLGVREGALVFALTPYGVPGSGSVAFSFLLLLSHILLALLGGLLELRRWLAGPRSSDDGV